MERTEIIDNIILIKVGTNTLTDTSPEGVQTLNPEAFSRIGKQVTELQDRGANPILITSAGITAGMAELGLSERPDPKENMPELQMLASIGWRRLLNEWSAAVGGRTSGGLLLTRQELGPSAPERLEALTTTHCFLKNGYLPIANENDAISHAEIAFGDNDKLAATFAADIGRSVLFGKNVKLVILSDVHGVYKDKKDPSSVIPVIKNIDDYADIAGKSTSVYGTGGMITKFMAARIAVEAGVDMWIANGRTDNAILRALDYEIGTHFPSSRVS